MTPIMVPTPGLPVRHASPHVAVGTDLFQILFTCAGVTYLQATTNHTVDLALALLLAVGSTVGAQIGARVSRLLRGDQLLIILASLALLVVGRMIFSITARPSILLSPVSGHSDSAETDGRKEGPSARNPIGARPGPAGLFAPVAVVRDIGSRVPIPVRVTPAAIEMNAFYSGAWVVVEGVAAPGNDIAVRVTGDEREEVFNKKGRVGPIWINPGKVRISPPQQAGTPYRVEFEWPRKAPPGSYAIRVHEFRNDEIQHVFTLPLEVVEVGFPAWMAAIAKDRAPLYGLACVVIALLAGFGIDFLATVLFGRRRAAAH